MPHEYDPADYRLTEKGARLIEVEQGADLDQAEYDILEAITDGTCNDLPGSYSNYTLAHETHELENRGLISRKSQEFVPQQPPQEEQKNEPTFLGPSTAEFPL